METIMSELKYTNVDVPKNIVRNFQFEDRYATLYEQGFTEYLLHTDTPYTPCFKYFKGDTIIGQSLYYYGEYTDVEVKLLHNFCNQETIVYDIGANIGYHSVGLASRAKHVYAFEPNDKNFKLLRMNAFHAKNISTINAACSDKNGVSHIQDFVLGSAGNHGELCLSDTGQECQLVKLDDFVKQYKFVPPHIVKIDVEGHEWEVICGMKEIIENNLPVIFYEHLHGDHLQDVSDYLESRGYKQYWFPVSNYNPRNHKRNQNNIFGNGGVLNVVAVPFHIDFKSNLPEKIKGESWEECYKKLSTK